MSNITFENYYKNYQKFSDEQKNQILEIAPRLRMLRNNKKSRSIIQAYPYEKTYKLNQDSTINISNTDEAISAYNSYVKKNGKEPAYVLLNQEILFIVADQMKNIMHNYQILDDGSDEPIVTTEEEPRFVPSVYEKVIFITGAAQGLGQGIARDLVEKGAYTIIADLNFEGAKETAKEFDQEFGEGTSLPVKINVADESDVQNALKMCVAFYGGLDVMVSNAGVVRAGSLDELSVEDFNFVTSINYNAYFIVTKYSQKIMK
ncbi:MAG: SDR family NAD(P)-dependent oxidoreductase, partial [Clostridiaceae bacterium]|nr:SDR family NAD(P)-dependent oxidoreductase [Clostridiaceae bacterium]